MKRDRNFFVKWTTGWCQYWSVYSAPFVDSFISLQWRHMGVMAYQITGTAIDSSTEHGSSGTQPKITIYQSPHCWHHDDVIKWKHFPRCWLFVRGIHRSPVNFPYKGQWRAALMFSLVCASMNNWINNREAGDLRRNRAQYDVTPMTLLVIPIKKSKYHRNRFHVMTPLSGVRWHQTFIMHKR